MSVPRISILFQPKTLPVPEPENVAPNLSPTSVKAAKLGFIPNILLNLQAIFPKKLSLWKSPDEGFFNKHFVNQALDLAEPSPTHLSTLNSLVNLRAWRTPRAAWIVRGKALEARILAGAPEPLDSERRRWRLDVEIARQDGGSFRLIEASASYARRLAVPSEDAAHQGPSILSAIVEAPIECTAVREPVTLSVTYELGSERRTEVLPIDDYCLLGDFVSGAGAAPYAALAVRYMDDPAVNELVERAGREGPVASAAEEAERLKTWIQFEPATALQRDPPAKPDPRGEPYVLSPSETLRLGGDCDDWAVFLGAYLARRGFEPSLAWAPFHVWVTVPSTPPHAREPLDLTGTPPRTDPLSEAPISRRR